MEITLKNSHNKNIIYIIKQEGLCQNKVSSTLVFTCNFKMGYSATAEQQPRKYFEEILHGSENVIFL